MKYTSYLNGNYDELVTMLNTDIPKISSSTTLDDVELFGSIPNRVAIFSLDRFSFSSSSRVAATIVLIENQGHPYVVINTSGGSQAVFFKMNKFGEETFCSEIVDKLFKNYLK